MLSSEATYFLCLDYILTAKASPSQRKKCRDLLQSGKDHGSGKLDNERLRKRQRDSSENEVTKHAASSCTRTEAKTTTFPNFKTCQA